MSTAESFHFIGMGNGFDFCPQKIDVTQDGFGDVALTDWCTLGGINKGNVAGMDDQEKVRRIELSRRGLMRLYYNLEKVNASINSIPEDPNDDPLSVSGVENEDKPSTRTCDYFWFKGNNSGDASFSLLIEAKIRSVSALYNGDKYNEENFVGYSIGITSFSDDIGYIFEGGFVECVWFNAEASLHISGIIDYEDNPPDPNDVGFARAYVEINGLHFICLGGVALDISEEVSNDPGNLELIVKGANGGSSLYTTTFKIDDFEFFDY